MARKRRLALINRPTAVHRNATISRVLGRKSLFEQLEDRRMLTGYFNQLATEIAGDQGALHDISSGLQTLSSVARLPLINKSVGQIGELANTVETFRNDLYTTLNSLDPAQGAGPIRHAIFEALGVDGADVLASKSLPNSRATESDVLVTLSATGVDISIDVGFTSSQFSSSIGLGVDSVPFQPQNNTDGAFTIGLKYHDFHFGYDTTSGAYFRTDSSNNELQLNLQGFLPSSFTAGLGFLNVLVTDNTPGTDPGDADLSLTLSSDITGGLGASDPPIAVSTPHLTGGLDLDAEVEVQAVGDGMPKIKTNLVFQWTLPDVSAATPMGSSWGAPVLQLNHVSVELGSLLGSLAEPIAKDVKEILRPLQPVFDVLSERIPGVSDISETLGQGEITLISLSNALRSLPVQPPEILHVIDELETMKNYVDTINSLADAASGWIDVGSFNISGPQGQSLLSAAQSALGDLGLDNWSSLVSTDGGVDFNGVKAQIANLLPGGLGDEINGLWDQLTKGDDGNGLSFTYPIVTQPSDVVVGMLLGQDKNLVTASLNLSEQFDHVIHIPVVPLVNIDVTAKAHIEAFAQVGYDTRGLREAIAPLYNGNNFDGGKLLDGLWIDHNTHLYVDGSVDVGPALELPDFAKLSVQGGLSANLHVDLAGPNRPVRPFAGDLTDRLFNVSGKLSAFVSATVKAGVQTPAGFIGFNKTWTFAEATLFQFDSDHIAVPSRLIPPPDTPPKLFSYDPATFTLTLNAGPNAHLRDLGEDQKDESFTVDHVSHLILFLPPSGLIVSDEFDISAFGITQRFTGRVDRVYADMGDGDDTIKATDPYSSTLYSLYGGDDDDNINVDGNVDVYIDGGDGNDTLDAGNGLVSDHANGVSGGPGSDTITFGDGLLSNLAPGASFFIFRLPGDTSQDYVTIDNSKAKINYFYDFYRDLGGYDAALNISSDAPEPSRWIYMSQYDAVTIRSGSGNDEFTGIPTTFSKFYGGAGNDTFITGRGDGDPLPVGPNTIFNFPTISFFGGDGFDTAVLNDSTTRTPRTYSLGVNPDNSGSTQIYWFDDALSGYRENLSGIDRTEFTAYQTSTVQVSGWDTGELQLEAGEVRLAADSAMWWNTTITVNFTPKITFYDAAGDTSQSGGGIDENGPYLFLQGGHRINVEFHQFVDTVTHFSFQTDYAAVDLTPALLAKEWDVSFDGGPDSTVEVVTPDFISPTTPSPSYTYRLLSDRLLINSIAFFYTSVGIWRINSGQGDDLMEIDYSTAGSDVVFDGGGGANTFVADDRLNPNRTLWVVDPDSLWNLLRYKVYLTNVGQRTVMEGSNDDTFIITNDKDLDGNAVTFSKPLEIDGGGGNDTFTIGEEGFPATFNASVRLDGQDGNDTFDWYGVNNVYFGVVSPVTLIGGAGNNTLAIDDKTRSDSAYFYDIYANRIKATQAGFGVLVDFLYQQMGSVSLSTGDNSELINVWGISSDITDKFSIQGNGGNSLVLVHPRDAADNATINGPFELDGGTGDDDLEVDDSARTVGGDYTIGNLIGATHILGAGSSISADSNVERVGLKTGSGADTVNVENFKSTATELSVATGEGDDVLWLTRISGDLYDNITDSAQFSFDGGGGSDTFFVDNVGTSDTGFYTQNGATLNVGRSGSTYSLNLSPTNFEVTTVAAGVGDDKFFVEALPAGKTLNLFGNWGFDTLYIGQENGNTQAVMGQVYFDAENGGGNLAIYDTANTTGTRFHIEPASAIGRIGGTPGDTLFGPGGSLRFANLSNTDDGGVSISLGSGVDTVFAAPQAVPLFIAGGGLSTGPADQLNLAFAGAVNPVQHTFGFGAGSLTSDNLATLSWTGFEQHTNDYVFPALLAVTNTLDSGPGSLRQAMLDANATPNVSGPDLIRFDIPGAGTHTIHLLSALPQISDPVIIDGTTQTGYAGAPLVELDGTQGGSIGLFIYSGGTTIRGLALNHFVGGANTEIWIQGPGGNVIQGNYLGTNAAGNAVFPLANQSAYGIVIFGSDSNVIGTDGDGINDTYEGNVISGHNTAGILLENGQPDEVAENNVIAGNRIGTSADGNTALANGRMGVFLISGIGTRIGTNSDGTSDAFERNIISGNTASGIYISDNGNVVTGNYIGANAAGTAALPNGYGVTIQHANNNRVGGTNPSDANLIADNTYDGVLVETGGTGNAILANSIVANGRLGINLNGASDLSNGVTLNDALDADAGSNNLQNYPQIVTAFPALGQTYVAGSVQGSPNTALRIEVFASAAADPSGNGEGQMFLGYTTVQTNAAGQATFVTSFNTVAPIGWYVSATATDALGNTSEFGPGTAMTIGGGNAAILQVPTSGAPVLITSPVGTTISASLSATSTVAPPTGVQFPFGFLSFTVSGLAAGAAVDVTLYGLDTSQISDYFKNGATPANHTAHWYDFLYGHATDADSAASTGMEVITGNVVLHLTDGQRGDDDLATNGTIVDVGGPVTNVAPQVINDSVSTNKNTPLAINVLSNDSDPDGTINATTVAIIGAASHGTTSINPTTGVVTYTPAANYTGTDSFTYTVKDDLGAISTAATVSIFVNAPPVAANDLVVVAKNTPLAINVLGNDSDSDGSLNATSVAIVSSASHGTLKVDPSTGAVTYTPVTNYKGTDSFTYKVKDNLGALSNVASVSITVETAPTAGNDSAATYKNVPVTISVLANDSDSDGNLNAASVTIVGAPGHGTVSVNPTTGVVTYTPAYNYTGADSFTYKVKDNLGLDSNGATVNLVVNPTGSISGKEYLDVTGNGLTADDTPQGGVKVYLDTNNNGVWNAGEPSMTTAADGGYSFADLVAGNYKVREVVPAGYIRTAPATNDNYSLYLGIGQNATAMNFANAPLGNLSALSNIVYLINGLTPVGDLHGAAHEGDTVQVSFTVAAGASPQLLTFVSYTAPSTNFDPNTASKQKIFDTESGVFGPGSYTLSVTIPHSYFQVDFVAGSAIDQLGPAGSNIFYSSQNRLISSDNGGSHAGLTSGARISGSVYRDANNNGLVDSGEQPIAGVKVTATAGSITQTALTDVHGNYTFDNLPAGSYTITETQPAGYSDGKDTLGNKGGTPANDKFSSISLTAGAVATDYNFGEQLALGSAVAGNQTQSIAWWNGSSGQALIKALNGGQTSKNLGNWLASNFNNLFGASAGSANDMTGKTNAQVAAYYQALYGNAARKPEAETLALALAAYVTNSTLAGSTATSYGFAVSSTGLAAATVNVGSAGIAFATDNNLVISIGELLSRVNAHAKKGLIWDADGSGSISTAEGNLRGVVTSWFDSINNI